MKLFIREPITVIFTLALPIIFLFVMGGVFGNEPDVADNGTVVFRGVGPLDYYIPAYFGLVMMAIGTVALPVHLAGYRERGVLRRLRASSISVWSVLARSWWSALLSPLSAVSWFLSWESSFILPVCLKK